MGGHIYVGTNTNIFGIKKGNKIQEKLNKKIRKHTANIYTFVSVKAFEREYIFRAQMGTQKNARLYKCKNIHILKDIHKCICMHWVGRAPVSVWAGTVGWLRKSALYIRNNSGPRGRWAGGWTAVGGTGLGSLLPGSGFLCPPPSQEKKRKRRGSTTTTIFKTDTINALWSLTSVYKQVGTKEWQHAASKNSQDRASKVEDCYMSPQLGSLLPTSLPEGWGAGQGVKQRRHPPPGA